jgi:hypothetical protein
VDTSKPFYFRHVYPTLVHTLPHFTPSLLFIPSYTRIYRDNKSYSIELCKKIISLRQGRKQAKNEPATAQHFPAQPYPQATGMEHPSVPKRPELCERCNLIFATIENLRSLVSSQGLPHYGPQELDEHAKAGCHMCQLLRYRFTPDYPHGTLFLQGSARDIPEVITQYPSQISSMGHLSVKWDTITIRVQGYTGEFTIRHICFALLYNLKLT